MRLLGIVSLLLLAILPAAAIAEGDVGMSWRQRPPDTVDFGQGVEIVVTCYNYGPDAASFATYLKLDTVVCEMIYVECLGAGTAIELRFREQSIRGPWLATIWKVDGADTNPYNDTLYHQFHIRPGTAIDLGCEWLPGLPDTVRPGVPLQPTLQVTSHGPEHPFVVTVYCLIEGPHGIIYVEEQTLQWIQPGRPLFVTFPGYTFSGADSGDYVLLGFHGATPDLNPGNDTAYWYFHVAPNPGVAEHSSQPIPHGFPTVMRTSEVRALGGAVLNCTGREVSGDARLSPGIYFLREASGIERQASTRKVIVTR